MAKELMEIGGFITEGAEIVNHDASLSGNGTVDSPLGAASDYIVVTEETVGTYTIGTSDVNIQATLSKTGYRPIAWTWRFGNAANINFNQETTRITDDNKLYFQGYAKRWSGSTSQTIKLIVTWVKIS